MAMSTLPLQRPHSLSLEVSAGGGEVAGGGQSGCLGGLPGGSHMVTLLHVSFFLPTTPCQCIDQQSSPPFSKWGDRCL